MTLDSSLVQGGPRPKRAKGLRDRLGAHKQGARSGDQFCIYVFDFLVLPTLGADDIAQAVMRQRRLDDDVRRYRADNLSYRWVVTPDVLPRANSKQRLSQVPLEVCPT